MQSDVLFPPNCYALSDRVVASVVQRASSHRSSMPKLYAAVVETNPRPRGGSKLVCGTEAVSGPSRIRATKRSRPIRSELDASLDQVPLEEIRDIDEGAYHRERRRRNQERYRSRQRKIGTDLENATQRLQDEIERLEARRNKSLSSQAVPTKETLWSVAVEYFRMFRRGLIGPKKTPLAQLDFLRATMAPDMDAGTVVGLDDLARNWRFFTEFFQDVQLRPRRLEQIAEHSLVASTTLEVTISKLSLHNMFPHLVNGNSNRLASIAEKLLGQRLVIRGSVRFDWDSGSNRVTRLISQGDLLSPLLQLLGNLDDVALAFSRSRIQPDANLVIGDYLSQYALSN